MSLMDWENVLTAVVGLSAVGLFIVIVAIVQRIGRK